MDLRILLNDAARSHDVYALLRLLIDAGYGDLPLPGSGRTLKRWQTLATVAEHDLSLAKLFESHADAWAILHELHQAHHCQAGHLWAVWCAEPTDKRVSAVAADADSAIELKGTKAWCSGAAHVSHALVSVWDDQHRPRLAAVALDQPSIHVTEDGWRAVGMAGTASVDVAFNAAQAQWVGGPDAYVERPGFQHGAAGLAACWYGAACAIAEEVRKAARQRADDPHRLAHLGAIDVALVQARSQLRGAAAEIDANPDGGCEHAVRRARLAVESAVETLLHRAPRAVGAGPMCKAPRFARMMADLPVFIRQSHAERDLAAHGKAVSEQGQEASWTL
ncbi:acyl-CoA dehydrogenase [Bordetella genomosp. 10]|uniref:Acyl-CoA dehydrogenase n=1 Tax=Bordetella genomosp. 10 TaxID=1416804 RepID=A0A261SL15_9BORD|nr:acyl-CoA dehydrogenase [Bordetella genomosp. 10]OZI38118.1 acyl-CoA dehydrogenase [Bordetella genomosp. 10]